MAHRPREELVGETWSALKGATWALFSRIAGSEPPAGATKGQMGFLHALLEAGRPLTPGDLAERLEVTPATVTGAVTDMEHLGLVTRTRDGDDRRTVHVTLTAKGRDAQRRWVETIRSHLSTVMAPLSNDELEAVTKLLARIAPPMHGPPRGMMGEIRHDSSPRRADRSTVPTASKRRTRKGGA